MLDNLRKFATTWPGKILGAFLLVGLAGFGITGVISSIGSNTVARVGDREISSRDFQREYGVQVNAIARQIGSNPTPQQALSLGIPGNVLTQLATEQALNILDTEFGLGVSEEKLGELLAQDPSFFGALGLFDRNTFTRAIQRSGYTENEYFQVRREAAERQQVALGLFSRAAMPQTISKLVQSYTADKRILDYLIVAEDSLLPIAEPTDEQLASFLSDNQAQYRTEEMRKIRALELTPEALAATYQIDEADIAAEYERTKDSLIRPETRTILELPLPSEADVRWFEFGLASGKNFSDLVVESGRSANDLGALSLIEISDEALANAVYTQSVGDVEIIDGPDGKRAVAVTSIQPGCQIALEEVRADIEARLALAKAKDSYVDVLDQIEEQRAAFIDMTQIAQSFGLTSSEISLSQSGAELLGKVDLSGDEAVRVAQRVFDAEVGGLSASVLLGREKTFWFDLLQVDEARDQSLEEIRSVLAADWMQKQRSDALEERAAELVQQLVDGIPFDQVAVANGLFPEISQSMGRAGDGGSIIDQSIAQAAFGGGEGYAGTARNALGDIVVFQVQRIDPAETDLDEANFVAVQSSFRDDVYSDFANSLREDAQVRVNQGVLSQVLGLSAGGAPVSGIDTGGHN